MKVGVALNMLTKEGRSDAEVFAEHMALGDLAEPLGFDSLWALEHHFTGYAMSPSPTQLLSYYAGRTKRVTLGTCVIVLPWHDPVRVAEQIALLDVMSGGRCIFGFGRGAASVEYAGFRIPMEEARPRFVEAAQIVVKALTNDVFSWEGEHFQIPPTSIRPRPISHPERRFYASSVSPESAEIMAKLGFGVLVVMQNEWPIAAADIDRYRELARSVGHAPRPPIILTNVACAESREEAQERAVTYLSRKWDSIDKHYHFSDGHLASVKGYEFYGKMTKTYSKMKDPSFREKATDFYVKIQVVGTPDECLQQLAELRRLTGLDHLVTEFGFGGMPHEQAELSMRLFADRVVPVLQRDPAFSDPVAIAAGGNGAPADRQSGRLRARLSTRATGRRTPAAGGIGRSFRRPMTGDGRVGTPTARGARGTMAGHVPARRRARPHRQDLPRRRDRARRAARRLGRDRARRDRGARRPERVGQVHAAQPHGGIDRPTSGRVLVDGIDLTALDEDARTRLRRRRIGFVFQFFNLIPLLTVEENLLLPLELNGRADAAGRARARALLVAWGSADRAGELSGPALGR